MTTDRQTIPLTRNQQMVFDVLVTASQPMSAYDILDRLRNDGFRAPLQVYRALDKLLELGMVHRLESINAFVACAHPHDHCMDHGNTAFAICEGCGKVVEFHDHDIDARLRQLETGIAFTARRTTIEIRGHCKACG